MWTVDGDCSHEIKQRVGKLEAIVFSGGEALMQAEIFLPAIMIPACASSSPAFLMM